MFSNLALSQHPDEQRATCQHLEKEGLISGCFLTLRTLISGFGSAAERPIKPFKKSTAIMFLKLAQLIKRAVWKICSSLASEECLNLSI